ncbi:hypothetical protein BGZ60DRAFT_456111 [Tricladium varicosporioides]|nr:hypothetical protein BGZ60DRAFT_456111 [Hymenoscyphus varicosporioides]
MGSQTTVQTTFTVIQPQQLLHYLPTYKVVICSACQYAIQPAAIARHLKEIHNIQRSNRKPYMHYISSFELDEAEKVRCLEPIEFPVPELPVQDGLRCEHPQCRHLCVSTKRMKSHWSVEHERLGQAIFDWQPVPLQTFFRGNLLRYFTDPRYNKPQEILRPVTSINDTITESKKASSPEPDSANLHIDETPFLSRLPRPENELLQYFISHTSLTIGSDVSTTALWQTQIPKLAHQHPFLMHGLLACASLNLAHANPSSSKQHIIHAMCHQNQAMPLFRHAINNQNESNCHAILAFAHLLVVNSFAFEKQDDQLFLTSNDVNTEEDILPSWLHFIRAGCSMLCDYWDSVENGPVKALAEHWDVPVDIPKYDTPTPLLAHFLSIIPPPTSPTIKPWSTHEIHTYTQTAHLLDRAFASLRTLRENFTMWDILRIWPVEVSREFLQMVSAKHPGALVLLAHYCVMLVKMERLWWFEGRSSRLLGNVLGELDNIWWPAVTWPVEEIGLAWPERDLGKRDVEMEE